MFILYIYIYTVSVLYTYIYYGNIVTLAVNRGRRARVCMCVQEKR